jgi:hypothetical protein
MSQMLTVSREGSTWIIRLGGSGGLVQEYHCATEAQAVRMAKLFGVDVKGGAAQVRPARGGGLALAG